MDYNDDILRQAHEAALAELGETWTNALGTAHGWLARRATPVFDETDDGCGSIIVISTNGNRYAVGRDGHTCACPAYVLPSQAGDEPKPCKHRGCVHLSNHYHRIAAEHERLAAALRAYDETFGAEVPYVEGVAYEPGAWVGTAHEAAERRRLGDAAVDAAAQERAGLAFDPEAEIERRNAWAEGQLYG